MANVGRKVTASATITFHRLTPRKAVMVRASTRDGNTRRLSMARSGGCGGQRDIRVIYFILNGPDTSR
jgi:hypothetical protein